MSTGRFVSLLGGIIVVFAFYGPAAAGPLDVPGGFLSITCNACHGFGGNSPGETVPNLAGMSPGYFRKAIQDYASGRRVSPEMEPYAKAVLELGVDQIAQFFAAQRKAPVPRSADAGAVARGRASSAQCAGCHGQSGKGDPAKLIPDLTGQPAGYLMSQLLLFKQEQRSPGDEAVKAMKAPLKEIPEATMADLAAYYSSLR